MPHTKYGAVEGSKFIYFEIRLLYCVLTAITDQIFPWQVHQVVSWALLFSLFAIWRYVGWDVIDHRGIPTVNGKQDAEVCICYLTNQQHFCFCSEGYVFSRPVRVSLPWIRLWFTLIPSRQMSRQCFKMDHSYLHVLPGWSLTPQFHAWLPGWCSWIATTCFICSPPYPNF